MPTILITTSSFDLRHLRLADRLTEAGFEIVLNPYKRRLTEDEVKSLLTKDVVGMIAGIEPLTERILKSAHSLKVIARCGVGLDSVDLGAAKKLGIKVSNTPDAPTLPVAELTLAHMLNLLRGVSTANYNIHKGDWKPFMGSLLAGKNVGIVGYGRIGRKVAELVSVFGASVLVHDVTPIQPDNKVRQMEFNDLLRESDIVTLHIPYSSDSYHIIGDEQIRQMKLGAYLLNISRGGLVDESALYNALIEKRLAGAGLDVFEQEPYSGPLSTLENVLLTAHMGSYAQEARAKQELEAAENLVAALKEINLFR